MKKKKSDYVQNVNLLLYESTSHIISENVGKKLFQKS